MKKRYFPPYILRYILSGHYYYVSSIQCSDVDIPLVNVITKQINPWVYAESLITNSFQRKGKTMKKTNEFAKARKLMSKVFKKDSNFRHTYVSNIACRLHDCGNKDGSRISWKMANKLAEEVLDLVFDS